MQYTKPYKLQLNLEISSPNMLELLAQLAQMITSGTASTLLTPTQPALPAIAPEKLEKRIVSLFHEIGIPSHIMGYRYLKDAIIITHQNKDAINSITKVLYPEIASRNHTTPSRVERAIRHAIEVAFVRGHSDFIYSLFGYSINPNTGKPTNAEFIAVTSDYLKVKHF